MTEIAVGKQHPLIPAGHAEGVRFAAGADGLDLTGIFDRLSKKDIRGWERGRLRLGLLPAGDHTLYILYELDGFCGWSDAPFSLGLVPADRRALPLRQPQQGRLLNLTLIDQASAVVKVLRMVSLSPEFCAALDAAIADQAAALPGWSAAGHQAEIAAALRRWPDSRDMVRAATILETAGVQQVF